LTSKSAELSREEQARALCLRLLTAHNLRFLLRLTAGARDAIENGKLAPFKAEALDFLF